MDTIRMGIVGFGGMGRGVAGRDNLEGATVTAVVEPVAEARRRAEEEFGLKAFESVDQMLDAGVADAAYVATPNKFHAEATIACLRAGLDVICEKPIAMNAAEGEAMVAAAREAGRKLTINLSYRATPHARALKQIVEGGELGDIYFARTGWLRNRGLPGRGWFGNKELAGGGPLIDLGVHRIDLALWLMGHPRVISVSGATYSALGRQLEAERGRDYTVEDLAAGFVRLDNGASMLVATSWALNSEWREDMYTYVYGTKAGVAHRSVGGGYGFEARMWGAGAGSFRETVLTQLPDGPDNVQAFVDAIRNDGPVPVDPEDAVTVQRVLDALYESAESGREVRLDGGAAAD